MSNNKIYSSSSIRSSQELSSNINGAYFKKDRPYLISKDIAGNFNTYRNWKEFDYKLPAFGKDGSKMHPVGKGVKSLFNNVSAVMGGSSDVSLRTDLNIPLLDSPDARNLIREKTNCTIKSLIISSENGEMGRAVYNYSDFMYCKHLGEVPNNYLITLRKFPSPCGDHIMYTNMVDEKNYNKPLPDMGRLITWIGVDGNKMENLLKYSYKLPWQENKAPVNEAPNSSGGGAGGLGKMLSKLDSNYNDKVLAGTQSNLSTSSGISGKLGGSSDAPYDANAGLDNKNRIIAGMQNTIQKVIVPGGMEGGMEFNQEFKLIFNYELRSYDGVNPRSAMMDLLGNILMVTYMQGQFFPGSYRGVKTSTTNLYANLPLFKDAAAGKINTPGDLLDSSWESVCKIFEGFTGDSPIDALKSVGQNIFKSFVGGMLNKIGRPEKFSVTSMITNTPTGQWHLTIGNPKHPIISVGNLILEDAEIEHYGSLGLDDFPTGLKVTVTLRHAKPRDSAAIEQMYLHGDNRIYIPMNSEVEKMYEEAVNYKSYTKTSTKSKGDENTSGDDIVSQDKDAQSVLKTNIYNRYFGTDDIKLITITSKEGTIGANDIVTSKK